MISNRLGTIFANDENPFALNVLQDLVENLHTIRTDLTRDALHSRKNLNKECDWPDTGAITIGDYKEMYDRSPIAHRVVGFMPDESWQFFPRVFEDEDASISTDFEEAFSELGNLLSRTQSWYKGEDTSNQIWEYLHRADKLSGIGHFGVILIGIDDGLPLDQPVAGFQDPVDDETPLNNPVFINNQREERKLLHLSVFSEFSVSTIEFENNNFSPRYRLPKFYHIDLGEVNTDYVASGREGRTIKVHWSRIVHIADNMDASEVLGVPRMRPVWNNLLDLMKIYGGDAEGYWKGCILNIFLESHPQLGGDVDMDESTIQERMWDMQNGLQRWAALTGLSAKTVAPTAADPKSHIDIQIDAICIKIGVPKRIFQGSERGELASSQDDGTWNDRLRGRRVNYLTPRVVVPFIDRLIQMGVLPEPKEYFIEWPDPETTTPQEKATVAQLRVDTMVKYIQGGVEALMDPMDFLVHELEISEDAAEGILERAMERVEEIEKEKEESAQEELEKLKQEQAQTQQIPPNEQEPPQPPEDQPSEGEPEGEEESEEEEEDDETVGNYEGQKKKEDDEEKSED